MWTYLLILLAAVVLISVFARRAVLLNRPKEEPQPEVVEEESPEEIAVKVSKADAAKVEALCERAEAMLQAGKDEEAVKCFVQALAIDAVHAEAQQKLAMLYLQKQMYGAAAALFQSLAQATEDPVHYSHLGLALYQQNEFEEAKKAYQTAVELDDSRPQRFINLAQVYRATGELYNAIMAVNKAIESEAANLDYLFLLVDLQMELENWAEARYVLKKVLDLEPENEEALRILKNVEKTIAEKKAAEGR